jgi:hypothetical protein
MMQLHLDEISRSVAEGAHAVLILDRTGWHTTGKLDVPDNIAPIFLPSRPPEQPGRERLAVPPPELGLKHRLRKLRRDRRRPMRRFAKAHRSTRNHHPPSECATALRSVSRYDPWDKCAFVWPIDVPSPNSVAPSLFRHPKIKNLGPEHRP